MKVLFGSWEIKTEPEELFGEKFYVCKDTSNPSTIELVFVEGNKLDGDEELVEFIKKEILK